MERRICELADAMPPLSAERAERVVALLLPASAGVGRQTTR